MTKAYIAALAVALSACAVPAQETTQNTLVVTVQDPSGALIPGAGIRAIEQASGKQFDTVSNRIGQAELDLPEGTYELRVQAWGFQPTLQTDVKPLSQMQLQITLRIASPDVCSPCVVPPPYIPTETPTANTEVSHVLVELLPLRAKRLRVRPHA
jgi:hypothetical protein